jgi:hypothetical protein
MRTWRIIVPTVALALAGGVGIWASQAGASAPPGRGPNNPPPIPALVNPDGTLNMKVAMSIPTMGADGRLHMPTAAEVLGSLGLTPGQINAMTPAQRANAHVIMRP